MMPINRRSSVWIHLLVLLSLGMAQLAAAAELSIARHQPCNLFDTSEPIQFTIRSKGDLPEGAALVARLVDEAGREIASRTVSDFAGETTVDFGTPGRGYYEIVVTLGDGDDAVTDRASLGVMDFVNRSAEEVREGGYVFGLKWWAGTHRKREVMDAMMKLGLQWTRIIQDEGYRGGGNDPIMIDEMFRDYPLNAVIKVERFPREAYDTERYGPIEEYIKTHGNHWVIKTIPNREVYEPWLKEQLKNIPPEQKVFEIWNEPWDKMSPVDFAELSQMIADIILEERPDAIIGPNLAGLTGKYEYDNLFIEAGGMKRMKMVALHPYARTTDRQRYQNYKAWIEEKVGHELEVYITEYGSHNTPEGPQAQSDWKQAVNVAQRSIVLYANGVKALIPHIAVSAERNPTYYDDWFGLFRRNETPKPALIAHANAARMIDGSKYLGDLWFGPLVEAMVFDKGDKKVLMLYHVDPAKTEPDSRREIEVLADGPVLLTDMLGRETILEPVDGKIKLEVGEAPVYLTGVSEAQLAEASLELRPDRWPEDEVRERPVRRVKKLAGSLEFDGRFEDWEGAYQFAFFNPAVNMKDASGFGYISWDDQYLYVGANVTDDDVYNTAVPGKLYREDSIELFVSTEPRETGGGFGPNDWQFFLTPTSGSGEPRIVALTERENGIVAEIEGARYFAGPTSHGWAIEVAIPWSYFNGFTPEAGARLMLDMRLNDADHSHPRWKLDPNDSPTFQVHDPLFWAFMVLEE